MLKFLMFIGLLFSTSSPELTQVTIDSVLDGHNNEFIATVHKGRAGLQVTAAGCPKPVLGSQYYLINLQDADPMMAPKELVDEAKIKNNDDLLLAVGQLVAERNVCLIMDTDYITTT